MSSCQNGCLQTGYNSASENCELYTRNNCCVKCIGGFVINNCGCIHETERCKFTISGTSTYCKTCSIDGFECLDCVFGDKTLTNSQNETVTACCSSYHDCGYTAEQIREIQSDTQVVNVNVSTGVLGQFWWVPVVVVLGIVACCIPVLIYYLSKKKEKGDKEEKQPINIYNCNSTCGKKCDSKCKCEKAHQTCFHNGHVIRPGKERNETISITEEEVVLKPHITKVTAKNVKSENKYSDKASNFKTTLEVHPVNYFFSKNRFKLEEISKFEKKFCMVIKILSK